MKHKYLLLSMAIFVFLILFSATSLALIPGDFGSAGGGPPDGCVDFEDLMIFAMAYGSTPSDANWNLLCDIASQSGVLEPDEVIDFEDLMIFALHYGEECPTVTISVANEVFVNGKTYVPGGPNQIFITFSSAVENPVVKVGTTIIVVFPSVDKKDWVGTGTFMGSCDPVLIEVSGVCDDFCDVKSVIVDSGNPYAELKVTAAECTTGYSLTIASDWEAFHGCCGDDCSGFAAWSVEIWDERPWGDYCAPEPVVEPIACAGGMGYPIVFTTDCIVLFDKDYWVTIALYDMVSNVTSYYGKLIVDSAGGGLVSIVEQYYNPNSLNCVCSAEDPDLADLVIGDCDGTPADECYATPPIVTTLPADNITPTSARLHGKIDDIGGEEPFDLGFEYRLKSGDMEITTKYGAGEYYTDVTGLTPETTYEFRFWAENSAGKGYGEWLEFYAGIVLPTVTTLPADNITPTSARLHGKIDDIGGEEPFDLGFEYRLKSGDMEITTKYGAGEYYTDVTGLTPETTYEFRFWAENSAGKGYGEWLEFTTPPENAKWTVMVYLDGDTNLESFAWVNLDMMESIGSTEEVNIVVQMDPYDDCSGTFRYYITGAEEGSSYPHYPEDIVQTLPEQDMTDPAVLTDFINWAGDNYPADHYMLFLVDHGGGWREVDGFFKGIFQDDTSGYQVMQILELAQSLDNANIVIDILDLDACLMQMIEVAWEIGEGMSFPPDYLIASEAISWTPVLPYDDFLAQLTANPDIEQSVICEIIVNGYINNFSNYSCSSGTMSALDLNSFVNNSLDTINNFANALRNSIYQNEISNAQLTTQNYAYSIGYRSKDLFDFAERIINSVPDCQSEAQAIMDFINSVIVVENHIGSDMENSHGLSIYLVDSPSGYDSSYDNLLQFAIDTQWDDFLQNIPSGAYALRDIGPAGGYIFYDKGSYSNGWRYLEAAPTSTEWMDKEWGSSGTLIGGKETGIGTGQNNTTAIVDWLNSNSETDRAAQLCDALIYGGYSDWFLPSKDELNLMYENLKCFEVGGFDSGLYWSSSEDDAGSAWLQDFSSGHQGNGSKDNDIRVRAIRAF